MTIPTLRYSVLGLAGWHSHKDWAWNPSPARICLFNFSDSWRECACILSRKL